MAAGTPFALAHTFGQTGPFRTPTLPRRGPENVVLAGSSVQPGVGVPMVVISGRLAAERITGPVQRRRRRTGRCRCRSGRPAWTPGSGEHTSELQSRQYL